MRQIFLLMLALFSITSYAQEYKPFKFNVSAGYAFSLDQGRSGGALFSLEPKYGLSDNFDVGLRLESAIIARGITVENNNQTFTGKASGFTSGLLTATYLFSTEGVRPFLGIGAGVYRLGESGTFSVTTGQGTPEDIQIASSTHFGFMARAGVKIGHFVAAVEYDAIPSTPVQLRNGSIDSKNAYIGIKVGVDIGGGR